jgi:hypothetical protein
LRLERYGCTHIHLPTLLGFDFRRSTQGLSLNKYGQQYKIYTKNNNNKKENSPSADKDMLPI